MALSSGMTDGQLYQVHTYARCDCCRTWWRKLGEARYRMMNAAGDGLPYETGYGEHVRDLTGWERSPEAGSSYALWTRPDDAVRGGCPTCTAAAAQQTLDLDAPANTTAADYTPDQAGHYDNPPDLDEPDDDYDDELVPGFTRFVETLDPRHGTAQVVAAMKAAGIDNEGHNWNWLANQATFAAIEHRRASTPAEPQPGEQLTLV